MEYIRPLAKEKQQVGRKRLDIYEKKISRSFTISPSLLSKVYDVIEEENLRLSPLIEELLEKWVLENEK